MSDNTHDPPKVQVEPAAPRGYTPESPLTDEQLAVLHVQRHATYALMREKLGGMEPLEVIRTMKHGGYRYKSRRGYPGVLVTDRQGNPVPDRMSFRQIAPILSATTGVQVTYETVRRWWEAVFPGEPDEPVDEDAETETGPVVTVKRRTVRRKPQTASVGDEHADAIRAAASRAKTTNPDVPSAVFLPPAE